MDDPFRRAYEVFSKMRAIPFALFERRFRREGDIVLGVMDGDEYITAINPHDGTVQFRDYPDGTTTAKP